jgi:D123
MFATHNNESLFTHLMDSSNLNIATTETIAVQSSCLKEQEDTVLPRIHEVLACQFSSWYPVFSNLPVKYKGRRNVTIPSVIISPLPDEFQEYLLSDRLILPSDTRTSSALLEAHNRNTVDGDVWSSDDDDTEQDDEDDPSPESIPKSYSFPSLSEQINAAIRSFHNQACIPKLNWSAPKDAIWINGGGGNMECRCAGDVFLLLKASDFCSYDLHHALQDVVAEEVETSLQLELILRKWCNLYPSQEFRCFVVQQQLVAISQRYHSQHWPYLSSARDQYLELIRDFFTRAVQPNVVSSLTQFVFDVYIDQKSRIWLIDINVWATRTDALLFHWSELLERASQIASDEEDAIVEFRIVELEHQILLSNPLSSYKAPMMDLVYLGGTEQFGSTNKFQEFMKLCERPTALRNANHSDNSDSDDDVIL